MRIIFILVLIVFVIAGLSFASENAHQVVFNYPTGSIEKPLSLLLVIAAFVGTTLGVIASLGLVLGLKNQIRGLKRSEAMAQQEIRNLRNMPLKDSP